MLNFQRVYMWKKEQAVLHTALFVEYCPSDLIAWHQNGAATWLSPRAVPGGHEFDHGRNPLLNSKWPFVLVLGISISNHLKTHLQKGVDHVFGNVPLFWNGERLRESKWLKSGSYISTQPNDGYFWKRSKGTERVDSPLKNKFGRSEQIRDLEVGVRYSCRGKEL